MTTTTLIWIVSAEFTDREDAVAFMELARELGTISKLSSRSVNASNGARPVRETRSGKMVLSSMVPGRSYDLEHFAAVLEAGGYRGVSAGSVVSKLTDQGDVERISAGVYKLRSQPGQLVRLCDDCKALDVCSRLGCQRGT